MGILFVVITIINIVTGAYLMALASREWEPVYLCGCVEAGTNLFLLLLIIILKVHGKI